MRQGLPVLSPILFILFVNDLADSLPEDAAAAIFADDVTIMTTHRKKEQAEADLQSLVDTVATWSQKWKLSLNADKCVTCFFSTDVKEAKWAPTINIGGQLLDHEPTPTLLGVTLDRTLCFSKQRRSPELYPRN